MKNDMEGLCERLGYRFQRMSLLEEAFRHSSYVNELGDSDLRDNERLEFLGDAVLDLAISHILMDRFKNAKEGELSKYRATIVNERGLTEVADGLGLADYLLLGKGEEVTHGRKKPSIQANTVEALLGAVYLDAGFSKAKEVIHGLFVPLLEKVENETLVNDYKSLLQEYTQQVHKTRPEYLLIEETGPAHDKTFKMAVQIKGQTIAEGSGKSKKDAEQKVAKEAYFCLAGNRRSR